MMDKKIPDVIQDKFLLHIGSADPLQIIIRGHLHLESELNKLILSRLAHPGDFDLSELNFPKRMDLAVALGCLNISDKSPYLTLNSLRNKLAHNLEYDVTIKDLRDLINSFPPNIRNNHKMIATAHPEWKDDYIEHFRWCIAILLQYLEGKNRQPAG